MNTIFKILEKSFSKLPTFEIPTSFSKLVSSVKNALKLQSTKPKPLYKPTIYLAHPISQVIYTIAQRTRRMSYERQRIFLPDGGNICLDWISSPSLDKSKEKKQVSAKTPICFVMHGLTGGSEMNYIKVLLSEAQKNNFRGVCLNSRGIGNQMTSPKPFTWIGFQDLHAAIQNVTKKYPQADIYMIGTSFGSNYLTRYLLQNNISNIKGYVGLGTPFDIPVVMKQMNPYCQKFFVKRYISQTILKHPMMYHWQETGKININDICKASTLSEFYERVLPLTGINSVSDLFNVYSIGKDIKNLSVPSLFINSIDDPIVTTKGIPLAEMLSNPNIKYVQTAHGGHLCWYQGIIPRQWYPKPTFAFFQSLRKD